ncbi:MAG: glutamate 5-kinase [Dehalococcoidales bacterium]|nr:glutamate 5-kinase [Dehalococcoidales bacterium]
MGKTREPAYKRIVAKLGTGLLTGGSDHLDQEIMSGLVNQVARLHKQGRELIIVSSGSIALGKYRLGLSRKIKGIPYRQVLAAVGQSLLMHVYDQLFQQHDITVAQALLAKADLIDRAGYLNARNTLLALLELRVIPVINENDVVAVEEIKEAKFGDNDNLSAMVANLVDADLLILLSDIAGLYTADPRSNPDATLIPQVEKIDARIESLATGTLSSLATGGMVTKIEAAKLATASGVTLVIADGMEPDIILKLADGQATGTRFLPASSKLESRQRWMLSGLSTRGKLIVDPGAAAALKKRGSLLAAGIERAEGRFERGDIVNIYDHDKSRIGCGITNYSSQDIGIIKGAHSRKITTLLGYDYGSEVVHRNNLVVL